MRDIARVRGIAYLDVGSGTLDFELDDVEQEFIPAVTKEVTIGETTAQEVVIPARTETLEEAVLREVQSRIQVDDVEKLGIESIAATVRFTITGTVEFDSSDWGYEDELAELDPDDFDEEDFLQRFYETLKDAALEDVRYQDIEFDVYSYDVT